MRTLTVLGAGLLLMAAVPMVAHHSIDAEFDRNKPVEKTGKVTKVEWMNPHIWIYMDVTSADGKVEKWQFEGGPPNALRRNGFSRTSLKEGDEVTIQGLMAKDGTNTGNAQTVRLADGKRVFARDPAEAKQQPAK